MLYERQCINWLTLYIFEGKILLINFHEQSKYKLKIMYDIILIFEIL